MALFKQPPRPHGYSLISTGEFGIVYKGYLKRRFSDSASETVAVKTLKGWSPAGYYKRVKGYC